jgi:hypothetical protein
MQSTLSDHPGTWVIAKMPVHGQIFERNETADQLQEWS